MKRKPKLLPCPFCGEKPEWIYHDTWHAGIRCNACGFSMLGKKHVAEKWNRRDGVKHEPAKEDE